MYSNDNLFAAMCVDMHKQCCTCQQQKKFSAAALNGLSCGGSCAFEAMGFIHNDHLQMALPPPIKSKHPICGAFPATSQPRAACQEGLDCSAIDVQDATCP